MSATATGSARFDHGSLAPLEEPVRRYLAHAIDDGALLPSAVRLRMSGRIKVGRWLAFSAEQDVSGHDFEWTARAGLGRCKPLKVVDAYRDGHGTLDGRVGRLRFMHADDENSARAAAVRAAVESIWFPVVLLPERGVSWRAERADTIVATFEVPPERAEVTFEVDATGAGTVTAERRFGSFVLPSRVSVGWWFGTPRFEPFFEATISDASFLL
jgi:hypothetical protein